MNKLLSILLAVPGMVLAEPGLVFHFDFSEAGGKRKITDQTGGFSCQSETADFQVEQNALRIAPGAKISIPSEKLPDLSEEMTVSAWIFKSSTPDVAPILMKGIHSEPVQFLFGVGWRYPVFCYKNISRQPVWKGVSTEGFFGSSIRYPDAAWLKNEAALVETGGKWYQVAAVYRQGTVRLYVNGVLAAEREQSGEKLLPNNEPFYLGMEPVKKDGRIEPYATSNMLLSDLRLYGRALSPEEITSLYQRERPDYPAGLRIPEGKNHTSALALCTKYLGPEYDPFFERTLKRTALYEKSLPENPFVGRTTTAAIEVKKRSTGMLFDGKPEYPLAVMPQPLNFATGEDLLREAGECVKDFSAAGVDIVLVSLIADKFWLGEGKYDWEAFDRLCRYPLKNNPTARIIIGISLYTPSWFDAKYPDELEKYYHGDTLRTMRRSGIMGSDVWLRISQQMTRDIVRHVEAGEYSGNVLGYLLGGGQSAEWYWPGGLDGFPGYSTATRGTFQDWLRKTYQNEETRLQKAWDDPQVTFATAEVPLPAERKNAGNGFFLDANNDARELDFRRFLNAATARHLAVSARAVKENSGKLVFAYHGYGAASVGARKLFTNGLLGLQTAFENPDIDCIAGLIDYTRRRGGDAGVTVNPFSASARLHGKLLWEEHDNHTHLAIGPLISSKTADAKETIAVIERGFGMTLTKNTGMWWNLIFGNDWFHQEEVMDSVAAMSRIGRESLKADKSSVAEVAFIFDEAGTYYLKGGDNPFLRQHSWGVLQDASRMGAPSDFYLLDDLKNPNMPNYKLYVFLNAWRMNAESQDMITRKIRKNNAVAVWCYAPGYLNEGGVEAMKSLTGIGLSQSAGERQGNLRIQTKNHPITRHTGEFASFTIQPGFEVSDPSATVLGTFSGAPALAVREFDDWRSVYSLAPLTKELLQGLCDYAGVHVYLRSFDVFNANHDYLLLHTSSPGEKTVTLREPAIVQDAFSQRIISRDAASFTEPLPAGATRLYRLNP